ncbi:synaptotagmin-12-like isoform X2 [Acanthaster planci]|uniref:Synaptotagmin-12-like isoform X2 n=1 Tax=Acanthaster planci TaxID=133434 RepID=A0A8B7XG58_ACAPL|nr:synaptotagmin-12-like isoform X2 [Acanthaster planci]
MAQVDQSTDISAPDDPDSGGFVEYENIFAKAEQAISAAAQESHAHAANLLPDTEQQDGAETSRDGSPDELLMRKLVRCYSSESLSSVTSESSVQENFMNVAGQIEVVMDYSTEQNRFTLTLVQATDLKARDNASPSDTYVKVHLMPEHELKGQTKVYRKSLNPVYNERITIKMAKVDLADHSLKFTVFAYDRHARHEAVGETVLKLGDVDLLPGPFSTWLNLSDINEKPADLGDILFSLSYLPTAERLTVVIVKARGLKWTENKVTADPFVKVYLLQGGKKISKKKSSIKRGDNCPIFNEAMMFAVPSNILDKVTIRITVAENAPGGKIPSIGHVLVGSSCKGANLTHWNQMLTVLRRPIAMWHPLRK